MSLIGAYGALEVTIGNSIVGSSNVVSRIIELYCPPFVCDQHRKPSSRRLAIRGGRTADSHRWSITRMFGWFSDGDHDGGENGCYNENARAIRGRNGVAVDHARGSGHGILRVGGQIARGGAGGNGVLLCSAAATTDLLGGRDGRGCDSDVAGFDTGRGRADCRHHH